MADQITQEIKDRLDVNDVIASYIQIKKAGSAYKAPCPFHHEKSPSLMISPAKQIWHCFGCGEGGDIFGFVMRYENISFPEALRLLAEKAGVQLPERQYQQNDEKELLTRINNFAANYYHQQLLTGKQAEAARLYLDKRGLKSETIKKWKIGFAPEDYHALEKALTQKKVSEADSIKAGLIIKSDRGGFYDRFRNRITFPIFNFAGDVIGFSARTLDTSADVAKYINSPETSIYNKSRAVFGLFQAKEAIRKNDQVVVVEGQMDVISLHQAGFENVVATSGTALTEGHLQLLGRLSKNMEFCFDADSAGERATRRASELALAQGFRLKIMQLPEGKDPDQLIKENPEAWEKSVKNALWVVDYYIAQITRMGAGSVEQARAVSESLSPLISALSDPIEQDHYVQKISHLFGLKPEAINKKLTYAAPVVEDTGIAQNSFRYGNEETSEKQLLGGAIVLPQFRKEIAILPDWQQAFSNPELTALLQQIVTEDVPVAQEVLKNPLAQEAQFMVESQVENLGLTSEALNRELVKSLYTIMLRRLRQKQQTISLQLKQAEHQSLKEKIMELQQSFAFLSRLRLEYENKITNL